MQMSKDDVKNMAERGKAFFDQGNLMAARTMYEKICQDGNNNADDWLMLASINLASGRLDVAEACCRHAISIRPESADAHLNLGRILTRANKHNEAIECYEKATQIAPEVAVSWHMLGCAYGRIARAVDAENAARRAIAVQPNMAEAYTLLGNALCAQSRFDEAIESYRKGLLIAPDLLEAHFKLGGALLTRGMPTESVASYRRVVELNPGFVEAYNQMGIALMRLDRYQEAIDAYHKVLSIKPEAAGTLVNLARAYDAQGLLTEAEKCLRHAVQLNPNAPIAHSNLGANLVSQGRIEEAILSFRQALEIDPGKADAHSNLLLCQNYHPDLNSDTILLEHKVWAQTHTTASHVDTRTCNTPNPERRLRIGYVSPDFWGHPVASFIMPVLVNHEQAGFEVFCYAEVNKPDQITNHFRILVPNWRNTCGLSDQQLIEMIRSDGIDILVDLAGHTANNRLTIFAARPAPIQVTYLGYPNTTGLSCIDYRITDHWADPPGITESFYTEKLVRLANGFLVFSPLLEPPPVGPLPARTSGHVTFGSFNSLAKMTDEVIDVWATVLQAVPKSRLIIKNRSLSDPVIRERYLAKLSKRGISSERVELLGYMRSPKEHLALYDRIDIGLDTFPYNGTTTTCEALWMGVPVVTLEGRRHAGRVGVSLLTLLGLTRCIGKSHEEYVCIAKDMASNLEQLEKVRAELRDRILQSPLTDGKSFTKGLESEYREMWKQWSARHLPTSGSRQSGSQ